MTAPLLATALLAQSPISLQRGGPADDSFAYWATADTFIASQTPEKNFGRDPLLSGGPGNTLLIQFGDLERVLKGRAIKSARLVLTRVLGETPVVTSVGSLQQPWGEGFGKRGVTFLNVLLEANAATPIRSATWEHRFGGVGSRNWNRSGARAGADRVEVPFSAVNDGATLVLDGLGPSLAQALKASGEHHGWAIELSTVSDFASSEAPTGRPVLVIETEAATVTGDVFVQSLESDQDPKPTWPAPGTATEFTAIVRSVDTPSGNLVVEWHVNDQVVKTENHPGIEAGGQAEFTMTTPWPTQRNDPRANTVSIHVIGVQPDLNPINNRLSAMFQSVTLPIIVDKNAKPAFDEGAKKLGYSCVEAYLQSAARTWNQTLLAHSRFSFAPAGIPAGLRLTAISTGDLSVMKFGPGLIMLQQSDLEVVNGPEALRKLMLRFAEHHGLQQKQGSIVPDPFAGLMGGGDTRNDSDIPTELGLAREPWFDPFLVDLLLPSTDLLSAADAALLIARTANKAPATEQVMPTGVLFRLLDPMGKSLTNITASISGGVSGQENFTLASGTWRYPKSVKELFSGEATAESVAVITVTNNAGETARAAITGAQLIEAKARSKSDLVVVPVRFPLPSFKVLRQNNLALNRLVTSSASDVPVQVNTVVDGNFDTGLTLSPGNHWVEVDLAKERILGEIVLSFDKPVQSFEIKTYDTGQRANVAKLWFREIDMPRTTPFRIESEEAHLKWRYQGSGTFARFVRFELKVTEPTLLKEILVLGGENTPR